jgi:SulP family sulfate permease
VALCQLGTWIKFIPYPLVTGFTTGIAVIIFSSQIKDFLGLNLDKVPADFIGKWSLIVTSLDSIHWPTFSVAVGTLALILVIRRIYPALPWGILAVATATAITWSFDIPVNTIYTQFGDLVRIIPNPKLPQWSIITSENWPSLLSDAFTIAFLAGIEALLSAIVADGMAGTRHKSNCELMAQGIANIASVTFGGIPATGAIARTAINVRSGAQTPLAGMIHSFTLLLILFILAPVVIHIPLASLSAVLVIIAWNMSELGHFRRLLKAPLGDVGVLMTTFLLTVLVDLTVAVAVGMVFASFLFMKRISDLSQVVSLTDLQQADTEIEPYDIDATSQKCVPPQVEIYEIAGPFFFGIADTLKTILIHMQQPPKIFILRMRKVPAIDASGMHALKELHATCHRQHILLLLSGVGPTLRKTLDKFGFIQDLGSHHIFGHIDQALAYAAQARLLDIDKKS